METDNPMLLREYPGALPPDRVTLCPCCGRAYEGFRIDEGMQWDCAEGWSVTGTCCEPVKNGKCAACAWERRTVGDELAYIAAEIPARSVLAYALCGDEHADLREEDCEILLRSVLELQSEYASELIGDYVADCRRDDFIEWVMGRQST